MPSIDERVVAMSFENTVFEARVATTMATLGKLDTAIKNIGSVNGLQNIEASANKVTLQAPMSALDKLKAKLGGAGSGAAQGFSDIDKAGNKVTLEGPSRAIDKVQGKMGQLSAGTTFTDIEKAADRVELSGLTRALDSVTNKFSVLQGAASVALGNITAQAALKGGQFAKSFAFGPIQDGMKEYQTNLQSIQTILANTQGQQVSGLGEVNKHLNELNTYSDKTIYNFSEMAKNIGTFTAAGVDLDTSTKSIKGIANLAALSGSNSQQASTAMYQLSQAISSGRVGLQDWNSVVNAGMGGAVFQKALERTGENMGTIAKGALKVDKATGKATVNGESFRNSIMAKPGQDSWLTSDVLTKTLTQFTGDLSNAQLKAQGFNDEQIKTIQQTAKSAQDAATQVKTLPQVFDVARETIGSGWAKTFQLIFGDFNQSKKTFTELSNTINGFINRTSKARNALLTAFDGLGGRDKLITAIKNAFNDLALVLKPIQAAFRNIFPATTAKGLIHIVDSFQAFTDQIQAFLTVNGPNLQRTFQGIFALLDIGWTIIKKVVGVIFDLLGVVGKGSGGVLAFTGSIGDFLVAIDNALVKGGALTGFFKGISGVLAIPVKLIQTFASALFGLFDGLKPDDATALSSGLDGVNKSLGPMKGIVDAVTKAWGHFVDILGGLKQAFQPLFDDITNAVSGFADKVVSAFQNQNYDAVMSTIQTTLVGGIFLTLRKALKGGLGLDVGGGVLKNVNESLHVLTGNLQAMQRGVQAGTLAAIAASIVLLAGGVLLLSKIDPKALTRAMTAVAVGLGELVGALALLSKFATGTFSLPFVAASMIALAAAITILAVAVTIFSKLSWQDLAKGLLGVAGSLVAVGVGTKLIGPGIIVSAGGVLAMAIALNVLAVAVKQFATLDWESMAKGLVGVAGSLLAISLGLVGIGPEVLLIGPGLVLVAIALSTLAAAVGMFGKLDPKAMFQGLFGIAGALVAIGLSVATIPPTVGLQAAGLVILAAALTGIAGVIKVLGGMDVSTLVKGIIAMGGAMLVLGAGLIFMQGTLGGSVALLAAAAAFAILGPTLGFLGSLKWGTIFKGLATIALVLGTLAVVGALAAAPLATLGGALVVLGIGFVAVTAPIYILAKALQLLGDTGTKGVAVMVTALTGFIAILPTIVINFIKGLVQIIAEVAKIAPQVLTAISSMLDTILAFVIEAAPKLAVAIGVLISAFLKVLVDNAPKIIDAGFQLLEGLIGGIASNIGHLTAQAAEIITRFLTELQGHAPSITATGTATIVAFLLGISNKFPALVNTVVTMITRFIGAVVSALPRIFSTAVTMMLRFIGGIVSKIPGVIAAGASILFKLIEGIGKAIPRLVSTAVSVAGRFVRTMARELVSLVDVGFHAMIDFMNGLARTIRNNTQPMIDAGFNLAGAIVDGMVKGFTQLGQRAIDAVGNIIKALPKKALKLLDAHSPSKVFVEIGGFVVQGLAQGLADPSGSTARVMDSTTQGIIDTARSNLSRIPAALDGLVDMDPVITPVLDLTQITRDAAKLSDMTNVVPIAAATSFGQASAISGETQAAADAQAAQGAQAGPTFNYEQNLYSPEALSDVEIYRQTKNQLSQVKTALGLAS